MLYKSKAEDFIVEEIPLYPFDGKGEHLILKIKKKNLTTLEVIKKISKFLKISEKHIGYAGLKDKISISIQHMSIPKNKIQKLDELIEYLKEENIEVLEITEHRNKLRPGHLKGNVFTVKLREIKDTEKTINKLRDIEKNGFFNHFDQQRLSDNNIEIALKILKEDKDLRNYSPYKKRLLISAFTSHLFNEYIEERKRLNLIRVLSGDIVYNQRNFKVKKIREEGEISIERIPTGPIWGSHMMEPENDVLIKIEHNLLERYGIKKEDFKKTKSKGTRRPIIVYPEKVDILELRDREITLRFFLPKGSYATILLKELALANQL